MADAINPHFPILNFVTMDVLQLPEPRILLEDFSLAIRVSQLVGRNPCVWITP